MDAVTSLQQAITGRRTEEPSANSLPSSALAVLHTVLGDITQLRMEAPSPRRMAAVLRPVSADAAEVGAGQLELNHCQDAEDYLSHGGCPPTIVDMPSMAEATRVDRAIALLHACQESLRGPLSNLLTVTARTGLIVTMTVALRETIAYYVQQALDTHNPDEATRLWATAGVFMVGPCLNLLGLLRDEYQGSANLNTRIGRLCMFGLTLGAGLAVALQGRLASKLSGVLSVAVYSVLRDVANTFFPLSNNVEAYQVLPNLGAAGAYGVVGGALEWLAPYLPSANTGASGAAAGLGYSVFATLFRSLPTVISAIQDDLTLPSVNLPAGAPLVLSVTPRWPSASEVATAFTTAVSLRMCAINVINFLVDWGLGVYAGSRDEGDTDDYSRLLGVALVILTYALIFLPFVHGTLRTPRPEVQTDSATPGRYTLKEYATP